LVGPATETFHEECKDFGISSTEKRRDSAGSEETVPRSRDKGAKGDGCGDLGRRLWFEPIFDKRYPELFGPIEGDA